MPIYEYCCTSCGNRFEKRRGMSAADDPVDCPKCESPAVQRLLSKVVCFSKGDGGQLASVGGGCGSCSSSSCSSCHH